MLICAIARGDSGVPEDSDNNATPIEANEGICETSEWGPWSECSVTCGVGVSTRRRHFRNHMGIKKCPLVATGNYLFIFFTAEQLVIAH